MRRLTMMWMVLLGMLVMVGCPGGEDPAENPAGEPVVDPIEPEVLSPLEMLSEEPAEPTEQTEPAGEIDASAPNAVHRHAGRSAFPEAGESIKQLIPAKRLSEADQFAEPIDPSAIPDVVPWTEAHKYIGYEITVEGKIVDVGSINEGSVNFLNFHQDWRDKFYLVLFGDLAKTLNKPVEQIFLGKTLRVTGEVEDHRGRPQVKILSMDQVQFVGE